MIIAAVKTALSSGVDKGGKTILKLSALLKAAFRQPDFFF
jgi:hypothetical protein